VCVAVRTPLEQWKIALERSLSPAEIANLKYFSPGDLVLPPENLADAVAILEKVKSIFSSRALVSLSAAGFTVHGPVRNFPHVGRAFDNRARRIVVKAFTDVSLAQHEYDSLVKANLLPCPFIAQPVELRVHPGSAQLIMTDAGEPSTTRGLGGESLYVAALQLGVGLVAIHSGDRGHGDIKPNNVCAQGPFLFSLVDLGSCGAFGTQITRSNQLFSLGLVWSHSALFDLTCLAATLFWVGTDSTVTMPLTRDGMVTWARQNSTAVVGRVVMAALESTSALNLCDHLLANFDSLLNGLAPTRIPFRQRIPRALQQVELHLARDHSISARSWLSSLQNFVVVVETIRVNTPRLPVTISRIVASYLVE
jgi:hypothetical protein